MKLNLILLSLVLLDATCGSALKKEKDRLVRHNTKSKKISLDDTKAASSSSLRRDNPEKPSSEETQSLRELDSDCPVFTDNPYEDPDLTKKMLNAAMPCGTYEDKCKHKNYEVIRANVDYPGEGEGDLDFKPYIVQFDIGVQSKIKEKVEKSSYKFHPPLAAVTMSGEQCFELIVKGGSMATGGCAGKCGRGCLIGAGYAKDCLKHDVCVSYKALKLGGNHWEQKNYGFCYDIDCGDEAAQAIFNCYIDYWFNDKSIICDESTFYHNKDAYGHWSYSTKAFIEGPCHNFVGWSSGQGIPGKGRISNPYRFLSRAAHHD